jgi:hypothetical protein
MATSTDLTFAPAHTLRQLIARTTDDVRRTLQRVPTIERFVEFATLTRTPRRGMHDLMLVYIREIGGG